MRVQHVTNVAALNGFGFGLDVVLLAVLLRKPHPPLESFGMYQMWVGGPSRYSLDFSTGYYTHPHVEELVAFSSARCGST